MSIFRICACGVLWLCLITSSLSPARADVTVTATGISSLVGSNVSQAEKTAFEDALYKAYLETALRFVPGSSSIELSLKLKPYIASRGNQDVIQYKIVSRSQIDSMLTLTMDIRINESPLKDWLKGQTLMTPLAMRPRILLVITTRGPGSSERHEWWRSDKTKGYSPFESQLAERMRNSGENVAEPSQHITIAPAGPDMAFMLGASEGANLVITGLLTHKSSDATTIESRLDLALMDSRTRQRLTSTTITLRGTVDQKTMNDLLITAVINQIRAEISKKVVTVNPPIDEKTLCIEDIHDNDTYQALLAALRSMETISKITVSSVQGHTICHTLQVKGSLGDILESLKQKNIVSADVAIEGNTAHFRILNQ